MGLRVGGGVGDSVPDRNHGDDDVDGEGLDVHGHAGEGDEEELV